MKKIIKIIMVFMSSFEMLFSSSISTFSNQVSVYTTIHSSKTNRKIANQDEQSISDASDILKKMDSFYYNLWGKKNINDCDNSQSTTFDRGTLDLFSEKTFKESEFDKLFANIKRNACTAELYITPKEQNQNQNKNRCSKVTGQIETLKHLDASHFFSSSFLLLKKAKQISSQISHFLLESEISSHSEILKIIIKKYIKTIYLSLYDLEILSTSFKSSYPINFFNELPNIFGNEVFNQKKLLLGQDNKGIYQFELNNTGEIVPVYNTMRRRNLVVLLKYVSKDRLMLAIKWQALNMLATQNSYYSVLLGKNKVEFPRSCNSKKSNFLSNIVFDKKVSGDKVIDNILLKNKMIHYMYKFADERTLNDAEIEKQDALKEYNNSLSYSLKDDPVALGLEQITPLEYYKYSMNILNDPTLTNNVDIDDFLFFDKVIKQKQEKFRSVFYDRSFKDFIKGKNYKLSKAAKLFQDIISFPRRNEKFILEDQNHKQKVISAENYGYSRYIIHLMQQEKILKLKDLIPYNLKHKLKTNIVLINFPSILGSLSLRNWAITKLRDVLFDNIGNPELEMAWLQSCGKFGRNKLHISICQNNYNKNFDSLLEMFNGYEQSDFLPLHFYNQTKVKQNWKFFTGLWNFLRDKTTLLEVATTNEYNLLFKAGTRIDNKWAYLRLGYLLFLEKVKIKKQAGWKRRQNTCQGHILRSLRSQVNQAAKVLGLDKPFYFNFANRILSHDEKINLWQENLSAINKNFEELLVEKSNNKKLFNLVQEISTTQIRDLKTFNRWANKLQVNINRNDYDQLTRYIDSDRGQVLNILNDLLKKSAIFNKHLDPRKYQSNAEFKEAKTKLRLSLLDRLNQLIFQRSSNKKEDKGDLSLQKDMAKALESFSGFNSSFEIRNILNESNSKFKLPLYRSLIRKAAIQRIEKNNEALNDLCNNNLDDYQSLKKIYFNTLKTQDELGQLTRKYKLPKKLISKLKKSLEDDFSMSPEEMQDLIITGGMIVATIGAFTIGSVLCGTTMGIGCLVGAQVGSLLGQSTLAFQGLLTSREVGRYLEAQDMVEDVSNYADLGLTSKSAQKSVSRSAFWSSLEVASLIPFVGIAAKGFSSSAKITTRSLKALASKSNERLGTIAKNVLLEEDLIQARHAAKLTSLKQETFETAKIFKLDIKQASLQLKLKKIKLLLRNKQINAKSATIEIKQIILKIRNIRNEIDAIKKSQVYITEDFDTTISKRISRFFHDDPKMFLNLILKYKKKLKHAEKVMDKVHSSNSKFNVLNMVRKIRNEHLVSVKKDIINISNNLSKLNRGDKLDEFILKNMDTLSKIFIEIPMRKREMPYLFLMSGGPFIGGMLGGKTVPVLSDLSSGIVLRKIFTARTRIDYERYAQIAKEKFIIKYSKSWVEPAVAIKSLTKNFENNLVGQTPKVTRRNVAYMKRWQKSVAKLAMKEAVEFTKQLKFKKFTKYFFKEKKMIFSKLTKNIKATKVQKILFSPSSAEEKILSDALWSKLNLGKVFQTDDIAKMANEGARLLINKSGKSESESVHIALEYINYLKILILQQNKGVVEIM